MISQPGSLTLRSTPVLTPGSNRSTQRPTLPRTRGAAPREKPPARHSGTLLPSVGFFTQRDHHHPSLQAPSRRGPLRSAEALRGLPYWWKLSSDVLKRLPNGASGPRAVPSKSRSGPWLSEARKLARRGKLKLLAGVGARAARQVWPQRWEKRIIWSVFDLGLRSQLLLYLFVCNLIFSKLGRWQQGRKEGMEEGATR